MKLCSQLFISALALLLIACNRDNNSAESFASHDRVFVLLEPSSLDSLNQKLSPSLANYGEVKSSDFVPKYKYSSVMRNMSEDLALAVYLSDKDIPLHSLYMPVRPKQLFEAVTTGKAGVRLINVNPDLGSAQSYLISQDEMAMLLPRLPTQPPLELAIFEVKEAGGTR